MIARVQHPTGEVRTSRPGETNIPMSSSSRQPPDDTPLMRAAQYVRMSTEHQQYSTENQGDAIRDYALARGYEIVKTYADDGKRPACRTSDNAGAVNPADPTQIYELSPGATSAPTRAPRATS
jgi:hypothetical protein